MAKNGDSAFLVARSIFKSDIWTGDPHLFKLWIYLIGNTTFQKNSPTRGTLATSFRQIQQDNSYKKGIVRKYWGMKKIYRMLNDLKTAKRITFKGTPKGTLINVIKYEDYQGLEKYIRARRERKIERKENARGTLASEDTSKNKHLQERNKYKQGKQDSTTTKEKINFNFDTEEWENITPKNILKWKETYPACDIELELKQMREWLLSNLDKRKKNYRRFITNWLARSQEKGGTKNIQGAKQPMTKASREDWINLKKAKGELERLATKDRILKWLRILPEFMHGYLATYLRRVYRKSNGESYDKAKMEYEREKEE